MSEKYSFNKILKLISFSSWFFGKISREKACDYLQWNGNVKGAFLIRKTEKEDVRYQKYALSLKAWQSKKEKFEYKHYRIFHNDTKTSFWINGMERYVYNSS